MLGVVVVIVWIVVAVLALLTLGVLVYGVQGARIRLARELTALDAEVTPVAGRLQEALAAASRARERDTEG